MTCANLLWSYFIASSFGAQGGRVNKQLYSLYTEFSQSNVLQTRSTHFLSPDAFMNNSSTDLLLPPPSTPEPLLLFNADFQLLSSSPRCPVFIVPTLRSTCQISPELRLFFPATCSFNAGWRRSQREPAGAAPAPRCSAEIVLGFFFG